MPDQSPIIDAPDDFESLPGNEQNKYVQPALTQQAEKAAQSGKSDEGLGKWALGVGKDLVKAGSAGMYWTPEHTVDLIQRGITEVSPAYKKRVENIEKAYQSATPEQRKSMHPAYMLEDPTWKALATPPSSIAGQIGFGAEQMGEQIAAMYLGVPTEGVTLPARLARIGEAMLTGGTTTVAQTGDPKQFVPGAIWSGVSQGGSEVARVEAPKLAKNMLGPWGENVTVEQTEKASARAVRPGSFIPISKKGLGKLTAESDEAMNQVNYLTKQHPVYSQRPINIDDLAKDAQDYADKIRRARPGSGRAIDKAIEGWKKELGYQSAAAGVPGKTEATVAEVEKLKQDMREGVGKWKPTEKLSPGIKAAMGHFQNSMQKAIEKAIPEERIGPLNETVEMNSRLKDAIKSKIKNNPKWLTQTVVPMALEVGSGELANWIMSQKGIGDYSQIASVPRITETAVALATMASRNPRMMTRLVYSLGQPMFPGAVSSIREQLSQAGPLEAPSGAPGGTGGQPPIIDVPDNFLDLPGDEQNKIIQSGGAPKAEAQPQAAPEPARPSPFAGQPPIAAPKSEPKAVPPIASRPSPRDQVALDREKRKGVNLTAGWKPEWDQALVDSVNRYNAGQHNPKDKMPLWLMRLTASQEGSVAASQAQNRRGGHTTPLTVRSTVHGRPGAVGLMQIMPATGAQYGYSEKDLEDPHKNTDAAVREMGKNWSKYHRADLALAAYNAGPGTLANMRYNFSRLPEETRKYVQGAIGNWFAIGSPSH